MQIFFFVQRYLDKQNDTKFIIIWEKIFVKSPPRFISFLFFSYMFVMFALGYMILNIFGFLLFIFLMMLISFYSGWALIIQGLKFLAVNNQRYMMAKMNPNSDSNINYDNVVN